MISIDPGDRSGWATWDDAGRLIDHGILFLDEMLEFIRYETHRVWVIEDYVLDHRASKQRGSRLQAVQVIGAVKLRARQVEGLVFRQRTESRDMGYLHLGLPRAKSHANSHDLDAIAHGGWWWEAQGVVPDISSL